MLLLLRTKGMQLGDHADTKSVKCSKRWNDYAIYIYIYDIKTELLEVRENEISLRKWSGGIARLWTLLTSARCCLSHCQDLSERSNFETTSSETNWTQFCDKKSICVVLES